MISRRRSYFFAFEIAVVVLGLGVHVFSLSDQSSYVWLRFPGMGDTMFSVGASLFPGEIQLRGSDESGNTGLGFYPDSTQKPFSLEWNLGREHKGFGSSAYPSWTTFFCLPWADTFPWGEFQILVPLWCFMLGGLGAGWLIFREPKSSHENETAAKESET